VQRISPKRPLTGSKSGIPKPPFRCARVRQSGLPNAYPTPDHLISALHCLGLAEPDDAVVHFLKSAR
jgi:hypothetical protein